MAYMLPGFMGGLLPQRGLVPVQDEVPPGFLAGPGGLPAAGQLGGAEQVPGGPVAGAPIPLGPATTLPGGMRVTPVSTPQAAQASPRAPGTPLEALREQFNTISQLTGRSPDRPYVRDQIESGSPTEGLLNMSTGRMLGAQAPSRVVPHAGDLADLQSYGQEQANRTQNAGQLLARLGTMGSQALAGGDLNLRTIETLGMPGTPGSMAQRAARNQAEIDSLGMPRQQDAQNAAAFNAFVQGRVANGGDLASAMREWQESGMSRPVFAGGTQTHPPVPQMTPQAAGGTPNQGSVPPPVPAQSPQSRMEQLYTASQDRVLGRPAHGQARRTWDATTAPQGITDFVGTLGEPFLSDNTPAVMRLIQDRFGGPAANEWFARRGGPTAQREAIQAIMNAANRRVPGTVSGTHANPQSTGPASLINSLIGEIFTDEQARAAERR